VPTLEKPLKKVACDYALDVIRGPFKVIVVGLAVEWALYVPLFLKSVSSNYHKHIVSERHTMIVVVELTGASEFVNDYSQAIGGVWVIPAHAEMDMIALGQRRKALRDSPRIEVYLDSI
jgi:hypothetical protein